MCTLRRRNILFPWKAQAYTGAYLPRWSQLRAWQQARCFGFHLRAPQGGAACQGLALMLGQNKSLHIIACCEGADSRPGVACPASALPCHETACGPANTGGVLDRKRQLLPLLKAEAGLRAGAGLCRAMHALEARKRRTSSYSLSGRSTDGS